MIYGAKQHGKVLGYEMLTFIQFSIFELSRKFEFQNMTITKYTYIAFGLAFTFGEIAGYATFPLSRYLSCNGRDNVILTARHNTISRTLRAIPDYQRL